MTGFDDDRSEEQVREDTIEDLLDSNHDDREADLLEYRLSILEDAIDRANMGWNLGNPGVL
jgi:hypothetical protein